MAPDCGPLGGFGVADEFGVGHFKPPTQRAMCDRGRLRSTSWMKGGLATIATTFEKVLSLPLVFSFSYFLESSGNGGKLHLSTCYKYIIFCHQWWQVVAILPPLSLSSVRSIPP